MTTDPTIADQVTDERVARAGIGALGDDEYGNLIRGGLERLAGPLDDAT